MLSNKGGRGQKNREEIGAGATGFYFPRGFAARSRVLRARISRLRRSCARLDKKQPCYAGYGYTRLLPEVILCVIALGWDRFGFPVRFSPQVTLQIITQGRLLTWQYLGLKVLTGLHDSCSSQIYCSFSLYSLALTRVSFRDFPLRYERRGGSLKIFHNSV